MMTTHPSKGRTGAIDIRADGVHYRDLNALIREAVEKGAEHIQLRDVHGQRYIGTNLRATADIDIYGTPGNDLGAFMNGPRITVHGNAQDGCGNTMNEGEIIVHGHAGDITGLAARGGKIFIREGVGYRAGIHMKEYGEKKPVLVMGGTAQDFLGEYMAGGIVVVLGMDLGEGEPHRANFVGTGMHGGAIYLRGHINDYQLGKEVGVRKPDRKDREVLSGLVRQFAAYFDYDAEEILSGPFLKLVPLYLRPYGRLYTY
jgi:glutamate synthase domain-containing protein 3